MGNYQLYLFLVYVAEENIQEYQKSNILPHIRELLFSHISPI